MPDPRITDNDAGEITATVNDQEVRGWSYKNDAERRLKMQLAHEFAEGWFQAKPYPTDLEQRLRNAEWQLTNSGFQRCDNMACNCGSWHQTGGFKARFDEIKEVIEDAGYSTNGRTLLAAVKALVAKQTVHG